MSRGACRARAAGGDDAAQSKRNAMTKAAAPRILLAAATLAVGALASPREASGWEVAVYVDRHKPCNMFWLGEDVSFGAKIKARVAGDARVTMRARDYFERVAAEKTVSLTLGANALRPLPLDFGKLGNGYYDMVIEASVEGRDGKTRTHTHTFSFGVAPRVDRSAEAVQRGGYRFGLKMWYLDKAWWRGNAEWDEREVTEATTKLGLQWTRALLQQNAHLPTVELLTKFPMNAVLKVESFPRELFDADRYGPLEEWVESNGRAWMKQTLPKKDGYQKWLRAEVAKIPPHQDVFEIWNEAWDKMSAEDLATLSNWIAEAILADRPDAIIGPNLMGKMSKYSYDSKYIDAGGMKGMQMVALHPYAGSEDRAWLRKYRAWLKERTGRDIDIYVTEYGSHSCPEGPSKRSEAEQARRVVRQSLALYAEDVKVFTPHWMGQREHNRTYHEHWFGFYRLAHEPKPVLIAHATSARMVDGSRYVGDVPMVDGMQAMLFEKDGLHTLALYTKGEPRKASLYVDTDVVVMVDMMGASDVAYAENGKVTVPVGHDVSYVVGLDPRWERLATRELPEPTSDESSAPKRNSRIARKMPAPPALDGRFDDWKGMTRIALVNPKVNGADASGMGYLAWDDGHLYVGIDMRDNQVMNRMHRGKLYRQDSLELFVSTEPRETDPGYGPRDQQFFMTPDSQEGGPIVGEVVDREAGKVVDVKGAKYHIGRKRDGWVVEAALPWSAFKEFTGRVGAPMALELRVNDADKSHERWKIDGADNRVVPGNPVAWSLLKLVE